MDEAWEITTGTQRFSDDARIIHIAVADPPRQARAVQGRRRKAAAEGRLAEANSRMARQGRCGSHDGTSRVCCRNKRRFNPTAAGKMNRPWAPSCRETGLPSTRRCLSVTESDTAAISTRRSSSRRGNIAFRRPRTSHCRSSQPLITRHVHGRANQSRHQPQRRREELLRYEPSSSARSVAA